MRRFQQKQILELLQTVSEAQAAGLYADCQQCALSVGEFIESIEGEGTETVALLEEYCEKLFQASNGEIGERALSKQLLKIENSVKNELKPNKTEMAFLSYKASMSDSLESIYFAAKEDPECDAYWIPIPYYDKNPDGTYSAMHYEGADCYSDKFICTDWKEYDIEARHPDVIFTFAPYDEENYVTSIHPDFYCKRLRELTDLLVYVPYFVVPGDVLADAFYLSAGVRYAHKVFVQSEEVRSDYIRISEKYYGDTFGKPEDKFITLGSPKFDKVINSKREDFELPEEWARLIYGNKPQSPHRYETQGDSAIAAGEDPPASYGSGREGSKKITIDMTDAERYELLKKRSITAAFVDIEKLSQVEAGDFDALERISKSGAFKILRKIGEEFGVFKEGYTTHDVDVEFGFSRRNLYESVHKQKGNFKNYAKMLTIIDKVINNAIGLEAHSERYKNPDSNIDTMYVFIGAFADNTGIIPVLLIIKTFIDNTTSSLYIAVSLKEIERSRIVGYTPDDTIEPYPLPAPFGDSITESSDNVNKERSRIIGYIPDAESIKSYPIPASIAVSLTDLLSNVNAEDTNLLKHIPDGFLSEAQKEAKQKAIKETAEYIEKKSKQRNAKLADTKDDAGRVSEQIPDYMSEEDCITFIFRKKQPGTNKPKKAIFYNTAVGAILFDSEQYLKKLRHVLETFKNRDDVVLWWRPHPLCITTFESMRPQLATEYKDIVDNYKKEGWGIYDDTPDLHRAIAWTDAYYGDWSSVVSLYNMTGKPVVLQNVENTENGMLLKFYEFATDNNSEVWGFDLHGDGLFKIDFKQNAAHYIIKSGCIPQMQGKKYLHSTSRFLMTCCVDSKIMCFPTFTDTILIYNQQNNETRTIVPNRDYILSTEYDGFAIMQTISHQGYIYCFGWNSKAIIVFGARNDSLCYHTELLNYIGVEGRSHMKKYVKYPLYISKCSEEGKVILIMSDCPDLILYTLDTQEIEVIASNPILEICMLADSDGQDYWVITNDYTGIIKWNPISDMIEKYDIITAESNVLNKERAYTGLVDCGDYLLLFPGYASSALKFDKKTKKIYEYKELPVPIDFQNTIYKYDRPKRIDNKIYAYARFNNTICEININTDNITIHKIVIDQDSSSRYVDDYLKSFYGIESKDCVDKTYLALDGCDLRYVSDFVEEEIILNKKTSNTYEGAGKMIFDEIKYIISDGGSV